MTINLHDVKYIPDAAFDVLNKKDTAKVSSLALASVTARRCLLHIAPAARLFP